MTGYRTELFTEQDQVSRSDVTHLWITEAGLEPEEAERRLAEILLVATAPAGELAGVLTTYLKRHDQLRTELWHTRAFVAGAHRQSGLALELGLTARDHLCERYASGAEPRGIGMLFEIESQILKRYFPQAVWPRTRFVFIGENAHGDHVRVFYFPGALAPEPDGSPPAAGHGSA